MYSQYQQYQQNGVGTTTTSGQHWNGSSWVSTPTAPASQYTPAASSYASHPNANLVATYTQYYYKWKQRADEKQKLAQSLGEGPAKAQALSQAQWATYYAGQSTTAAHHYSGSRVLATAPPLPPAPPETPEAAAANTASVPQAVASQSQQKRKWDAKPAAAAAAAAPGGMKEYVHRCLARCSTQEEKLKVQKEVEKIITKAIQNGTMHTMNWDTLQLIEVGGNKQKRSHGETSYYGPDKTESTGAYGHQAVKTEDSYYGAETENQGPYGKSTPQPKKKKTRHGKKKIANNYYGKLPSYDDSSVENNSYYGSGSGLGDEDFVAIDSSPATTPRSKKKILPSANGFERSSLTLSKRANRFSGRGGMAHAAAVSTSTGESMNRYMGMGTIGGKNIKLEEADYENLTVKGTCRTLEKQYLRLTAPPKAELVRPQPILEQHVQNLKQEWSQTKKRDYAWFCSQFKAVRQDLTVQRINNGFTVDAYETHARIALQEGDLNEYNQCQTQLKELYDVLRDDEKALKNANEFIAYRIIYYVFLTGNKKYEGGSSDLFKIMLSLTPSQRDDPAVSHALKVRVSVAETDYHAFFRLQDSCPNLGAYLMDFLVPKMRHWGLQRICKAYRPSLPVLYVLQELGFDPKDSAEVEEGKQWLSSCGCVMEDDEKTLSCKDSVVRESDMSAKTSSLI